MKSFAVLLLAATAMCGISGVATAADLAVPAAPAPTMAAPAPTNWDGPYVGASVGYGWGTVDFAQNGTTIDKASPSGFLVGAQLGYNFHLTDQLVGGIEGNVDWVGESGAFANNTAFSARVDWEGSIRARLGVDVDSILPYIEAGVAFANAGENSFNSSKTYTGWTAGVGMEFMLADNLSANVEYRYSDYGSQTIGSTVSMHPTDSTARVGLNYHF